MINEIQFRQYNLMASINAKCPVYHMIFSKNSSPLQLKVIIFFLHIFKAQPMLYTFPPSLFFLADHQFVLKKYCEITELLLES